MQAQIIELLSALRLRHNLAYLFVSHNLAVVRLSCERVAVMRHGPLVEAGAAAQVLAARAPLHAGGAGRRPSAARNASGA